MMKYLDSSDSSKVQEVKEDLESLFSFAKIVINNDLKENALKINDDTLNLSRILTFVYNARDLLLEHSGNNTFNLLKEKDSFYSGCSIVKDNYYAYKNETLKVKVNDCKYLVKDIYIDSNLIDSKNYKIESVIEIKDLSSLETGNHLLEIEFANSKDSTSFKIFNKKNNVNYIYVVGILTTILILVVLYFYDKKVNK